MMATPNSEVVFDLDGFKAELERQEKKLRGFMAPEYRQVMPESYLVTNGRESGVVLAKSLLEKYTVVVNERKPS